MARRYTRRYRRGRKYYRRRFSRKRYARGVDRNNFCITKGVNVTYTFPANTTWGTPDKFINFAVETTREEGNPNKVGIAAMSSEKFITLARLYDQVRLTGMSVKFSYATDNGLSAKTLSLVTMVDRSTTEIEISNVWLGKNKGDSNILAMYKKRIDRAASRRKVSLTGGKTVSLYYRPSTLQEKEFIGIDQDGDSWDGTYGNIESLSGTTGRGFNGFNPCIYSYIERPGVTSDIPSSITLNVEIKYYVQFRNSC